MSTTADSRAGAARAWWMPVIAGLVATAVSAAASWIPSFWSDEVATVRIARLPLGDLLAFLRTKDAVHGLYDVAMHVWGGWFGWSELALRLPSAIGVGVAAAGLVLIGRMLARPALGILAAAIFAVLPRTTYMGAEARSYAWTAAVAVILSLLLLVARRRRRVWIAYGVIAAVGVWLFVYLALLPFAHAVFLRLMRAPGRVSLRHAVASLAGILTASPLLVVASSQRDQIAWLSDQDVLNAWTVLAEPWAETSAAVAIVGWLLLLIAAVRWRAVRSAAGGAVLLGLSWAVVPAALLLAANAFSGPLYSSRYLSFCAPGVALVLASAVVALRGRVLQLVAVGAIVAAAVPTIALQRTPFAKNGGSDLRQVADVVAAVAVPGDGILFAPGPTRVLSPRMSLYGYPDRYTGLDDLALRTPFPASGDLVDETIGVGDLTGALDGARRVVLVVPGGAEACRLGVHPAALEAAGLSLEAVRPVHRNTVCVFGRP